MASCAVEGCTSRSKKNRELGLRIPSAWKPRNEEQLRQWEKAARQIFSKKSVICDLHFREEDIIRFDSVNVKPKTKYRDGKEVPESSVVILHRKRPALVPDAVPYKFPFHTIEIENTNNTLIIEDHNTIITKDWRYDYKNTQPYSKNTLLEPIQSQVISFEHHVINESWQDVEQDQLQFDVKSEASENEEQYITIPNDDVEKDMFASENDKQVDISKSCQIVDQGKLGQCDVKDEAEENDGHAYDNEEHDNMFLSEHYKLDGSTESFQNVGPDRLRKRYVKAVACKNNDQEQDNTFKSKYEEDQTSKSECGETSQCTKFSNKMPSLQWATVSFGTTIAYVHVTEDMVINKHILIPENSAPVISFNGKKVTLGIETLYAPPLSSHEIDIIIKTVHHHPACIGTGHAKEPFSRTCMSFLNTRRTDRCKNCRNLKSNILRRNRRAKLKEKVNKINKRNAKKKNAQRKILL